MDGAGAESVGGRLGRAKSVLTPSPPPRSAREISSAPQLPWDFKFVSDDGQEVTASKVVDSGGKVGDHPTNVQFSLSKGATAGAASGRKLLDGAVPAPQSAAGFGAAFDVSLPAEFFGAAN